MTSYPFQSIAGPTRAGWPYPSSLEYECYVRGGAATAGDVYKSVRLQGEDAGVTFTAGKGNLDLTTHILANVVAPTAPDVTIDVTQSLYGVALRNVADDGLGRLLFFGYVTAFVIAASGSTVIGSPLAITTAKNFDLVTAADEILLGTAQEVMTTPSTRTLGEVFINGVGLFGTGHIPNTL